MSSSPLITCRHCRQGGLQPFERIEDFHPPGKTVEVSTLAVRCENCGKESVLPSQMAENIVRRRARQYEYGHHMLGENIFAFRRKYGLSQQAAAKIFGKGIIAFSRYENEKTFPDDSTRKLIQMAEQFPDVLKKLADDACVEIPLWGARCADSKAEKVREIKMVKKTEVMQVLSIQEQSLELAPSVAEMTGPEAAFG